MKIIKSLKSLFAVVCCITLASCAAISIPEQPSSAHIETLIESREFTTALTTVNTWQAKFPDNTDIIKQRKRITQAISDFERQTITLAKQQENDNQWQEAIDTFEMAMAAIPSSKTLQEAYSEFSLRHLAYTSKLQESLDVEHAKHWIAIEKDIQLLYGAAPSMQQARLWKERSQIERQHLAKRLIEYGLEHEKAQHQGTAALRFDLAYRLAPGDFTKPYHEQAAAYFSQSKAKKARQAAKLQKQQLTKLNQLLAEFDDYLANEKFRLARQTLGALQVTNAQAEEVIERKTLLDRKENIALAKAIREGKRYYTEGDFARAITVWRQGLEIEPDNKELKKNIQRAEKFQENLQRLKYGSKTP